MSILCGLAVLLARYFSLWLQAYFTGTRISLLDLVLMSLRKANPRAIVPCKVMAVQSESRAMLVLAEAELPAAIAMAFRVGQLHTRRLRRETDMRNNTELSKADGFTRTHHTRTNVVGTQID